MSTVFDRPMKLLPRSDLHREPSEPALAAGSDFDPAKGVGVELGA
mgnify:CR=1 FL=1